MSWAQIKASWQQLKGRIKQRWGALTHNAPTTIAGKREQLAGKLQEKYAHDKAESEKELEEFAKSLEPGGTEPLP